MSDVQKLAGAEAYDGLHTMRAGSEKKLLGLLGFAARARKLVFGTDQCRDEIRRGRLSLALVASDAASNTYKRIFDACKYYGADICRIPVTADELSARIGKTANITVVGVTDVNFINGITALFDDNTISHTVPKG